MIFRVIAAFLKKIWENPTKFHEKQRKSRRNLKKIELFSMSNFENAKKIDENLLKYWSLSGAKACKSCRSRQEFSNEHLLAKFGFDAAENEPLKVWFNFHIITPPRDLIFTSVPRPTCLAYESFASSRFRLALRGTSHGSGPLFSAFSKWSRNWLSWMLDH